MSYDELDYIANEMYQAAKKRENGVGGTRWWCLRYELRDHWRREARTKFLEWANREMATEREMRAPVRVKAVQE